ncbi:MAG: type II toxin-antitoxin system PemK/MazF family toxin [Flavonifractor plautii]
MGSEQGACVRCDRTERHRQPPQPTVIAAAITSRAGKARLPTHIDSATLRTAQESVVLLEQIRTLDKRRLREHMGRLDEAQMQRVDNAIAVSFGLHTDTMV